MLWRSDDPERLLAEGEGVKAEISGEGDRASEAEVESARCYHFPHAFWGSFFEVDGDFGMTMAVFGEDASEEMACGWSDVSDPEFAFFAQSGSADGFQSGLMLFEERARFAEEGGSGVGEADAFAVTVEEDGAEEAFHLLDCSAEGGLGDPETG